MLLTYRLIFLIFFFFGAQSIAAYQPGKWSPMDVYVEQGREGGPISLVLKNSDGQMLETAKFEYDRNGRLMKEKFYSAKGKYTGVTEYTYVNNVVSLEILKDAKGNIISTKEFKWGKKTLNVIVMDNNGKIIMRHYIRHKNYRVTSGREKDETSEDQFQVQYDKKGKAVKFKLIRTDGSSISEIHYMYDSSGKLTARLLKNNSFESKCVYKYDLNGNIISFTYFNQGPGKWIKDRSMILTYGQKKILSNL